VLRIVAFNKIIAEESEVEEIPFTRSGRSAGIKRTGTSLAISSFPVLSAARSDLSSLNLPI